jgi:hypothetical protein
VTVADAPLNWPEPPPASLLEQLLVFVGIPLLVMVVVSLAVMAPSLARGPRFSPGQQWDAKSEWFGAPEAARLEPAPQQRQLQSSTSVRSPSGRTGSSRVPGEDALGDGDTGGASVRW